VTVCIDWVHLESLHYRSERFLQKDLKNQSIYFSLISLHLMSMAKVRLYTYLYLVSR